MAKAQERISAKGAKMFFKEDHIEQDPKRRREDLLEDIRFELRAIKWVLALLVSTAFHTLPSERVVREAESKARQAG